MVQKRLSINSLNIRHAAAEKLNAFKRCEIYASTQRNLQLLNTLNQSVKTLSNTERVLSGNQIAT